MHYTVSLVFGVLVGNKIPADPADYGLMCTVGGDLISNGSSTVVHHPDSLMELMDTALTTPGVEQVKYPTPPGHNTSKVWDYAEHNSIDSGLIGWYVVVSAS